MLDRDRSQRNELTALATRFLEGQGALITRDAEIEAISAAATSAAITQDSALAEANGKVEALTNTLAETESALAESTLALDSAESALALDRAVPPTIDVQALTESALLPPGTPYRFAILAGDLSGLAAVEVQLNGETVASYAPVAATSFVQESSVTVADEGRYTLTVTATDKAGNSTATAPLSFEVLDYERRNGDLLAQIESNVSDLRDLQQAAPITVIFLAPQALAQQGAAAAATASTQTMARETALYVALDFVEPGFDLACLLCRAQWEQRRCYRAR